MKMKKHKYLYILVLVVTILSCEKPDDFLDVIPTGRVVPTTLEDFNNVLNTIDPMFTRNVNTKFFDPDILMNDITYTLISNNNASVNAYAWQSDLTLIDESNPDYNECYQFIHIANFVLSEIDDAEVGTFNPKDRVNLKAEAYALRAIELFLAVTEFAPAYDPNNRDLPAIPMPLEVDLQALYSKSTLGEVYDQILADANSALSLFTPEYPDYNRVGNHRPGKASVHALLAEVHLNMGNFEEAKNHSNIALAKHNFLYDWNTIDFVDSNDLFSGYNVEFYNQVDGSEETLWSRSLEWGSSNTIHVYHPDLVALFDQTNDRRWYLKSTQTTSSNQDVSPDFLYFFPRAYSQIGMTVPRLILTNAEAKARTGDGPGAIAVLNTLLQNRISNFTPLVHSDNATTLQTVKNERRKELHGTALNLLDLKRYHVYGENIPTFTRTIPLGGTTVTLEPGDDDYYVKIPAQVRDLNPNLN